MRTHRKYTVLAVAGVAALSLGLTACGGSDATRDEGAAGAAPTASASSSASTSSVVAGDGTTGGGSTAHGSTTGGDNGTGGSSTTKASQKSSSKAASCTYKDVKITAAKVDETPTEHIVLTATNTSGRACRLDGYPLIAFGEIQTAKDVPAVAKSKPAAPVVLEPGAPAYANVRIALGGVHEDNKVVSSFNVNLFAGADPAEGSVVVKAPAGGLAVDEAAARTGYWTPELRNGADEF
ncbi:DUF4232 domain-containing protein [Streptomyces sp. NPDC051921]|uniref:DUF4232 domain-containing protein n=1 Tax=Streptomyces sp. NPDC051921 TaxID=3155806 RepID=UPI003449447C